MRSAGAALAAAAMFASCAPRPAPPAPLPLPPPIVQPQPQVPPPPAPPVDWQVAPLSPGDWTYRDGPDDARPSATFQGQQLAFVLRCERNRMIMIGVSGPQPATFTVRTTYGERRLAATAVHLEGVLAYLPPTDPLFDQMAFSRGRFMVQPDGGSPLILPAWPEIARVVEECRA